MGLLRVEKDETGEHLEEDQRHLVAARLGEGVVVGEALEVVAGVVGAGAGGPHEGVKVVEADRLRRKCGMNCGGLAALPTRRPGPALTDDECGETSVSWRAQFPPAWSRRRPKVAGQSELRWPGFAT